MWESKYVFNEVLVVTGCGMGVFGWGECVLGVWVDG